MPDFDEREQALQPLAESRPKGAIDYSDKQQIIADLLEALRERRVVRMRYRPGHGAGVRTFTVAPLKLVAYREGLYVRCCYAAKGPGAQGSDALLQLAVHRIQSLTVTARTFDPAEENNGANGATFGFVPGNPFRVRVAFSPGAAAYVSERTWSGDQSLETRPDGGVTLEFTATSPFEVLAWVLGFGADAELLAPLDLRIQMRQKLVSTLEQYTRPAHAIAGARQDVSS